MINLVHNEKVKLLAAYFNNLAVAILVAGAVAPFYSVDQHLIDKKWFFWSAAICGSAVCRLMAEWQLNKLKE